MCGLFGWIKFSRALTDEEIFQAGAATELLAHRGPDAGGQWHSERFFAGHRRLKVIDLSDGAAQPFWSRNRRFLLLYNGEIYNYLEIRDELADEGVVFSTASDTEVFLAAFIRWGEKAFNRFDGMFAASIYDTHTGEHYLVRDHMGQKPLYYYIYGDGLIYASELRSLLSLNQFSWQLDRGNFLRYLSLSYYAWDNTPLQGVKKLLPGCYLKVEHCSASLIRYWDSLPGENLLDISPDEALLEVESLLTSSVGRCMRADVPVGVFFSGGVDSSLLLQLCLAGHDNVKAYSVAMTEPDYDEGAKAGLVSRHIGRHEHKAFTLTSEELRHTLMLFLSCQDEPHGDPGSVNALFLAKSCRDEITVALSGDGGDELFAGYETFKALRYEGFMTKAPAAAIAAMQGLAGRLLPGSDSYLSLQFKLLLFLQGFSANNALRFPLWLSTVSPAALSRLCPWEKKTFFDCQATADGGLFSPVLQMMAAMKGKSRQEQLLYYYQKYFMPEFVCMHTDRSAMQASLEVRSPFLSVPLVEFANRLPDRFKLHQGVTKVVLRKMMVRAGFPSRIAMQKKQGFTFPLARWLKSELKSSVNALVDSDDDLLDGLIDKKVLRRIIHAHFTNQRNYYRIIYNLICFEAWRRQYPQVRVSY